MFFKILSFSSFCSNGRLIFLVTPPPSIHTYEVRLSMYMFLPFSIDFLVSMATHHKRRAKAIYIKRRQCEPSCSFLFVIFRLPERSFYLTSLNVSEPRNVCDRSQKQLTCVLLLLNLPIYKQLIFENLILTIVFSVCCILH